MTIVEQLKDEGRHEGRLEGALISQIQSYQEILNVSVNSLDELAQKNLEQLEAMFRDIKVEVRNRLQL